MKKYLSIKIVGHDYVKAWKNEERSKPNQPHYKGDGVAVWIHEYKEEPKEDVKMEEEEI